MRHVSSETFIEPEIIPPFHSHIIPKPHMCQFMQYSAEESHQFTIGWLIFKHIVFCVRNKTYILHGSEFVLRTENLIILIEHIAHAEEIFVIVHPSSSDLHELFMHYEILQTLSTHNSHLGVAFSLITELMPGPCRNSIEIRRYFRSF